MSLIDTTTPRDAPVCEKHNFKGYHCMLCEAEEKQKFLILLREVVMRQHLAFPETEQDQRWCEEEIVKLTDKEKEDLLIKVINALDLKKEKYGL